MKRNVLIPAIAGLAMALALPANAGDLNQLGNLSQEQFRKLSEDLGAALSYKGVTPATPLGLAGFDLGIEVSATDLKNSDLFRLAGGDSPSTLYVPKVHLYKGLSAGFDIGAFVGGTSSFNATLFGADARFAFLDDTLTTPAVALRVSGTKSSGGGDLDVTTYGADLMVSKKFTILTPYAGAGVVRVQSKAGGTSLAREEFSQGRGFIGVNVNFGVINLAFEAEKMGGASTLSAKAGWRF
jgi:hypothetical protein